MGTINAHRRALERVEEAREKLDVRLADIEKRREEVRERQAAVLVEGDEDAETEALRRERAELGAEAGELESLRPVLRRRIEEEREAIERALVVETAGKLRKRAGGAVGEHGRRIAAAEEYDERAAEARRTAEALATKANTLADALQAIGAVLGVDVGKAKRVPGASRSAIARLLTVGKLRRAGESALSVLRQEDLLTDEVEAGMRAAIHGLTDEEEERRQHEKYAERRETQAEEREAAREAVDAVVREKLAHGPVAEAALHRAVKAAGYPVTGNAHDADLNGCKRRLGLVRLERPGDPKRTPWWMLSGHEVPDGFRPPEPAAESWADVR